MHLVKTRYSVGTMPVLFDHRSFGRGVRKAFLPIDIWPLARWHTATAVIFERLRLTLSSVSRKVPERLASHLVNRQCFPWKTWAYDPQQVWALYRCICMHIWMENCGLNNSPDTSCSLLLQATNEGASFLWSNMYEMSTHENSWEHKYYRESFSWQFINIISNLYYCCTWYFRTGCRQTASKDLEGNNMLAAEYLDSSR